jgi:hypothetical protein
VSYRIADATDCVPEGRWKWLGGETESDAPAGAKRPCFLVPVADIGKEKPPQQSLLEPKPTAMAQAMKPVRGDHLWKKRRWTSRSGKQTILLQKANLDHSLRTLKLSESLNWILDG